MSSSKRYSSMGGMAAILSSSYRPSSSGRTVVEEDEIEDMIVTPRRDKGKGKMKYLPELPEEVWQRIWAFYYGTCAIEWHETGKAHHALAPLLLSSDHTRNAYPVFYAHTHVGYNAIPSFLKALATPSPWVVNYNPPNIHIRHLTIRASSPSPTLFSSSSPVQPAVVHSLLPRLFSYLPRLLTVHIKDTLVIHSIDATILFSALQQINPRKARLEFRMWDLTDSPFGPDIIAATRPSIYTSTNRTRAIDQRALDDRARLRTSANDPGRLAIQEQWRDALWEGSDLDLPPWWIEIPKAPTPGAAQPGQGWGVLPAGGGGGGPGFGGGGGPPGGGNHGAHVALMALHHSSLLNLGGGGGAVGAGVPQHAGGLSIGHAPWPTLAAAAPNQPGWHQHQGGNGAQVGHPVPAAAAAAFNAGHLSHHFDSDDDFIVDDDSDDDDWVSHVQHLHSVAHSLTGSTHTSIPSASATATSSGSGSAVPSHSFGDWDDWNLPSGSTIGSTSDQLSLATHLATADPPIGLPPTSTADTLLRPNDQQQPKRTSTRPPMVWERNSTAHPGSALASPILQQPSSGSILPSNPSTSTSPISVGQAHPTFQLRRGIERMSRRYRLNSPPPLPTNPPTPILPGPSPDLETLLAEPPRIATVLGVSSYHLAHHMRRQLSQLITEHWTPTIQALSIVAFDPLASLIVRSPQLDLWVNAPIPHIRVHLPRAINSLAVFKGPAENARDRNRNRRNANIPVDPSSEIPSEPDSEEARRVVGGDGYGGELVNEETRLFEIEVNTISEMGDQMWDRAGDQLPPQVCRLLVGDASQSWDEATYGNSAGISRGGTVLNDNGTDEDDSMSSSTEASENGSEGDDMEFEGEGDIEEDEEGENNDMGGWTYDRAAAQEQEKKVLERKASRVLGMVGILPK